MLKMYGYGKPFSFLVFLLLFLLVILMTDHIPLRFGGKCDLACQHVVKCHFWKTSEYYNSPELFHWAKLWFLILKNCSCQFCEDFVTQAMDQIHPVHCRHHGDPSCDITGSLFSSSSLNRAITMTAPWDHMGWPTYVHWQKTNSRKESDTTDIVFLQSLLCQLCNPRDHLSKRKRALPVHLIENRKRKQDAFLFLLWIASLTHSQHKHKKQNITLK